MQWQQPEFGPINSPLKKTKKVHSALNDRKIFVCWTKAWKSILGADNRSSFVVCQPRKTSIAQHGIHLNKSWFSTGDVFSMISKS